MKSTCFPFICFMLLTLFPLFGTEHFIARRQELGLFYGHSNVIMIASPGRSGSTLLKQVAKQYARNYVILKTHLLPPDTRYKGKILFIFSNPDQAAESALFRILHGTFFGTEHFKHVQTADRKWLKRIGGPFNQTEQDNLLSYDALGVYKHLQAWFYTQTEPTTPEEAQVLAIKFENLWDRKTIRAIRQFLRISHFKLPPREERGHQEELLPEEIAFRKIYNLGTEGTPRYAAYDHARVLWEQAPPIQYFKLKEPKLLQ